MAMDSLHDFSTLTLPELYAVYRAIAGADHRWRMRSFYGDCPPLKGHSEFRPLPMHHFQDRFRAAQSAAGGDAAFREQLARQATAYRVDVRDVLDHCRAAA